MIKEKKISSVIFFGLIFTIIIFAFSVGKSSLDSEIEKYKVFNPENNKVLNFEAVDEVTTEELIKLLEAEDITVMLQKKLLNSGIMLKTYISTNGLYYKEDLKSGRYFEKEDYKNYSNDVIISSAIKEKELKQEYLDANGGINTIQLNKIGQTYTSYREMLMPFPLYEKLVGGIDIKDITQVVVISSQDTSLLDTVIKKIANRVKEINGNNELKIYDYMPYNFIQEQNSMENVLIILFLITILNTIGIAKMIVNKRRKEIIIRKIVGASNIRISLIFFGELFVIGAISIVLAMLMQQCLSFIFNGYILNINIALSLSNFSTSVFVALGVTLITTIPFMYYISKVQPIEETRGSE